MRKSNNDQFRRKNISIPETTPMGLRKGGPGKPFIVVLALIVWAVGMNAPRIGGAETAPQLTKQQVKMLIKTAKTPKDHLKLARYYRSEAARLTAEASDHQEMETAYNQNPSSHIIPKWPSMGEHCKNLVEDYTKAAKEATEMADMHQELSKNAAQ